MVETTGPPSAPPSPPERSRIVLIVLGVIAVILLGAILVVLLQDDDDDGEVSTAGPSVTTSAPATTTAGSVPGPECSADALLDAVHAEGEAGFGIAAEGSEVVEFECTPTSAGDVAGGYAWARLMAPDLDPLIVFFTAYAGNEPEGGATFSDWQVLFYGSDVACEDQIPAAACDLMPGAPRR